MEYFLLSVSAQTRSVISPTSDNDETLLKGYNSKEFEQLPKFQVGYFRCNEDVEILDVLKEPTFLISDKLKSIFEVYEPNMEFKGVKLYSDDVDNIQAHTYWVGDYFEVDSLHSSAEFYPNSWLKKLVLDEEKIIDKDIFKVANILETRIIVSLRVAESILRRKTLGVSLTKVEVR